MTAAGKPNKVILIAVARKLLVFAHVVIRTQKPFEAVADSTIDDNTNTTRRVPNTAFPQL